MADKAWCPGCDSLSSSVLAGLREEGKCPFCGLSAEVIEAVHKAREHNVDEETVNKMLAAEQKVVELQARNYVLEHTMRKVKNALLESGVGLE